MMPEELKKGLAIVISWGNRIYIGPHGEKVTFRELAFKGTVPQKSMCA